MDASFAPGGGQNGGFNGDVFAIAVQPDGRLLVVGNFTSYQRTTRNRICRLNSDATLDTSLDAGAGANVTITHLALQPDGSLVIGGRFTSVAGQGQPYVARLGPTGLLDQTFTPKLDDIVTALVLEADGKIVIGGEFLSVNGIGRSHLARLNPDGSLDPAFNPPGGADAGVFALAMAPGGKILLGGEFANVGGVPRARIARLNNNGSVDTGFDPGPGPDAVVTALSAQADDRVVAGGNFLHVGTTPRHYLARFNVDGMLDSGFSPNIDLTVGGLQSVTCQPDGKVIATGDFDSVGLFSRTNIARFWGSGSLDWSFDPASSAGGNNPFVRCAVVQADGKVLVGGSFTTFNGLKLNRIARLTGDQGASVEFTSANFSASESTDAAVVSVRRTGSIAGTISVDCFTRAGSATPWLDFVPQYVCVTFAPGETSKSFAVPMMADFLAETDETVQLQLGDVTGGAIPGQLQPAVLTIHDVFELVPVITSLSRPANGLVDITVSAAAGAACVLEWSTNFTSWTPVATNTATNGVAQFLHTVSGDASSGFYRVMAP